ncbi:DUF4861 family protein [Parapedobacter koreensis]|uniref:DUF4861 domain-containing protein n=1 Tax=Parapedobacter koreensis TaxID=332977 RepID=A0A1H7PXB9_9SPHI|nr:DUF4861 family protein [Parapedobacter koreensis]SEL39905.1 protein of unknown function [Parapedobacter koreensis]
MRNKMNGLGCFFFAGLLAAACGANREHTIVISNPLNQEREELVSIPYGEFVTAFSVDSVFRVIDVATGEEVAYQLETQGADTPQQVLLQVSVPASGELSLAVEAEAPVALQPKAYARYVPERYDDFAWENDVVAFRMYGKALEGRPDDAQGLDLWSKRTTDLVIDKWYAHGDYHTDHGEGMDYYSVGQTLGAGDIAPYVNGSIDYGKHYRTYEILDNGPLRTTFKLGYEPWQVNGKTVSVSKVYSLDAGSQLNKVEVTYSIEGGGTLPAAIGVARRAVEGEILNEQDRGILGYWEPEQGDYGITGVGVVLAEGGFESYEALPTQYIAVLTASDGQPITYFNGGTWNKAGRITSANAWFDYVKVFKERQASPLKAEIK